MAKPSKQSETKQVEPAVSVPKSLLIESTTFGISKAEKGLWYAVRVQSDGQSVLTEILSPKRFNQDFGETKHSAVGRVIAAFREFVNERAS